MRCGGGVKVLRALRGDMGARAWDGEVYCEKCQPKVAELPVPKKKPARIMLPEQKCSIAQRYVVATVEESEDLEAVGGVA